MSSSAAVLEASFASQLSLTNEPVVSVDWLHANLREPDVKVLDASWYMPDEQRNPLQEYQVAHIPGAIFFDIDGISDRSANLPHMLPSEEAFAAAVSALGIESRDRLIVYDGMGLFSAARVWWMFRVFGHDKIWVLDGGMPRWRASGFEVESSASSDAASDALLQSNAAIEAIEKAYRGQLVGPVTFQTKFQPHFVWALEQVNAVLRRNGSSSNFAAFSIDWALKMATCRRTSDVKKNIEEKTFQHIDARSRARFDGVAPEPRKGLRSGHIPGSKCIPFPEMLDGSQALLPADELKKRFEQEGISLDKPILASCGTGVTACILVLGLHRLGKTTVPVYDGSWTEWATRLDISNDTRNA